MHRISVAVTLGGWIPLLGALMVAEPGSAEDLVVPTDYATIQEAIFLAREGDRVVVESGVYPEALLIEGRRDLTLIGIGDPSVEPEAGTALLIVDSQKIRISGLAFRGQTGTDPSRGIVDIQKSSRVVIRDVSIGRGWSRGVNLRQANDIKLSRLRIIEVGLECLDIGATSSHVALRKSELFDCATRGVTPAVVAADGRGLVLEKNRFGRCSWDCLVFKGQSRASIVKNEIEGAIGSGIQVHKGHRVIGNTVGKSRVAGIEVTGSGNLLRGNVVTPRKCGLEMERDRNELVDNDFGTKCRNGKVRKVE